MIILHESQVKNKISASWCLYNVTYIHTYVCVYISQDYTILLALLVLNNICFSYDEMKLSFSKRNWPRFLRRTLIKLTVSLIVASQVTRRSCISVNSCKLPKGRPGGELRILMKWFYKKYASQLYFRKTLLYLYYLIITLTLKIFEV